MGFRDDRPILEFRREWNQCRGRFQEILFRIQLEDDDLARMEAIPE